MAENIIIPYFVPAFECNIEKKNMIYFDKRSKGAP